jgi:hypothetical protein
MIIAGKLLYQSIIFLFGGIGSIIRGLCDITKDTVSILSDFIYKTLTLLFVLMVGGGHRIGTGFSFFIYIYPPHTHTHTTFKTLNRGHLF